MSSQPIPEHADFRQLRTQAKELLKELQAADPSAKLAEAQLEIARCHGYPSWPKLVDELETPLLIARFKAAVEAGDATALDVLLRRPTLRRHIDDPLFSFDTSAFVYSATHRNAPQLLPVLARRGADPNSRSKWWAGSYGALELAKPEIVDLLLSLGTQWDVWSAAAHGRVAILRDLLDADPDSINAPGGDGESPLHFASTPEVVDLLIDRGANLEVRDIDHESTPAQYQIGNLPVLRKLIERGAKPEDFIAAVLDEPKLLSADKAKVRVGNPPFVTTSSTGGHIYLYKIGQGKTPGILAAERGSLRVLAALLGQSPGRDLVAAAWAGNKPMVDQLLALHPEIEPEDHSALAVAAFDGRSETVRLLTKAGFDPLAPGMDSGTALHVAAWKGHLEIVRLLIGVVPLDTRDANHNSTPIGWAVHGAVYCRNPEGDYPAIVSLLLEAGSEKLPPEMAGDREDVRAVLSR